MTLGFIFWFLMLLWLLFGLYLGRGVLRSDGSDRYVMIGGNFVLFLLFFVVGWRVFGFPIQG